DDPDERPDRHRDRGREQPDRERDAGAPDRQGQDRTTEVVGAERVFQRRGREGDPVARAGRLQALLAGEQRREDRHQDEQGQHDQADHTERALPVGPPDPSRRGSASGPGDLTWVPWDLGRQSRLELDAGGRTFLERGQRFGRAHQPALTLGSRREYRMSAMRLAMITAAENSRNSPWSSGKSFESIACTVSRPSPG